MQFTVRTTQATITTWAQSAAAARDIVAKAEGCPDSAILSATPDRAGAFRASPILESYLATMLEDVQLREGDDACTEQRDARDSGTIYDCPDDLFMTAASDVERFETECDGAIRDAGELEPGVEGYTHARHYMTADRIGSRLYLSRTGSGVGFLDDDDADCLAAMEAWAQANSMESPYFGDDGKVYSL